MIDMWPDFKDFYFSLDLFKKDTIMLNNPIFPVLNRETVQMSGFPAGMILEPSKNWISYY